MSSRAIQLRVANDVFRSGDWLQAVRRLSPLLRDDPANPELLSKLGYAQTRLGAHEEGRRNLLEARRLAPDRPVIRYWLAMSYSDQARYAEAIEEIEGALALAPEDPRLTGILADTCCRVGDFERAAELIEPMLDANPSAEVLVAMGKLAPRLGRIEETIGRMRSAIEGERLAPEGRAGVWFQLAALLDRAGRYDEAFDAAQKANSLRPLTFKPGLFLENVQARIAAWTPEVPAGLPRYEVASEVPVFVVGMPRSGTTLIEQIIASHSRAHGGGELPHVWHAVCALAERSPPGRRLHALPDGLTEASVAALGRELLGRIRSLDPDALRITDKLPANVMNLGIIYSLAPGARVVHCRRHPLDTCLSCYFQQFTAAVGFAGDLEHLATYYAGCLRTWEHWRAILDLPMREVVYEELVDAPERGARALIDFLGLGWEEACLRFHESGRGVATASVDQVRRPIYRSSIGRWRHYEHRLRPLRDALERLGVPLEE